jgi:Flp pilus assembly protein TadG
MFKVAGNRLARCACRLLPARLACRFVRQEEGAAAVEFGLVALPFLALLFAILETALVFFAGQTLEAATADSARLVMTGQAQLAGYDEDEFKEAVCDRIHGLFDCKDGIHVDVKKYASFAAINDGAPIKDGKLDTSEMGYQPGEPGEIVKVTLYYEWPVYVSLLGNHLATLGSNRLLVATSVFRNEPFK